MIFVSLSGNLLIKSYLLLLLLISLFPAPLVLLILLLLAVPLLGPLPLHTTVLEPNLDLGENNNV